MFLSSIFIAFKLFLVENFVQYILITFIFPPPILPRVVLSSLPTQLDALSPSRPIHAPQEHKLGVWPFAGACSIYCRLQF